MTSQTYPLEGNLVTNSRHRLPLSAPLVDTTVIARRNFIRLARTPQLVFVAVVIPVMFVTLFRAVFGGAVRIDGLRYIDYLVPAVLVQNIVFDLGATAVALAQDAKEGVIDRFRSLPMAPSAVLIGRAVSDVLRQLLAVGVVIALGSAIGFRFHNGVGPAVLAIALCAVAGLSVFWVFALIGFGTANPESAQAMTQPSVILVFLSSAIVPVNTMPGWLQPFARNQPMSQFVDAVRTLAQGRPAEHLLHHTATYYVGTSLLWCAALTIVFGTLTMRAYRKL